MMSYVCNNYAGYSSDSFIASIVLGVILISFTEWHNIKSVTRLIIDNIVISRKMS